MSDYWKSFLKLPVFGPARMEIRLRRIAANRPARRLRKCQLRRIAARLRREKARYRTELHITLARIADQGGQQ